MVQVNWKPGRRRLLLEPRWAARVVAAGLVAVLPIGLLSGSPVLADPPNSKRPTVEDSERTVAGKDLPVRKREPDPADKP
ncbi:hypothetical protein ACFQ07_22795, partial [Actinomadura adrarensis]